LIDLRPIIDDQLIEREPQRHIAIVPHVASLPVPKSPRCPRSTRELSAPSRGAATKFRRRAEMG
jgi:hypothetical protein